MPTATPYQESQPLQPQISHAQPSLTTIQLSNVSFTNFLQKEPEITSVEVLEAKLRSAEVHDKQKKKSDSDAFKKLLEQLNPGNLLAPQPAPQLMANQMNFGGGLQVSTDYYFNRQDILKTPEAQVLVQSKLSSI